MLLENGQPWFLKNGTWNSITCCDCGLNHLFFISYAKKEIMVKYYRDDYKTARKREKMSDGDIDYIIKYMQLIKRDRKKVKELRKMRKERRINMQKTKRNIK